MALMHASVSPGALFELPWNPSFNALAYVLARSGRAGSGGRPIQSGQLVAFGPGEWIAIRAADVQDSGAENLEVLVLGGHMAPKPQAEWTR
jgi:quercetin 2,3-dioxygenase